VSALRSVVRTLVVLIVGLGTTVAAAYLFLVYAEDLTDVAGVLLVGVVGAVGLQVGARLARGLYSDYDVAEVAVEGPISRDGGPGPLPTGSPGPGADDVVDQVERADEDDAVDALLVKLNTPGGEVVPSDDIRLAAERFDGPTVAYTTDTCASGGYWIASGCDELWAREGSIVGSIGVVGSRVNAADLAERLGVEYERLAAGEYKDAGTPLREWSEDEREYLQGLIDGYYENFVERVADGRELDPETVRETEARVYLGEEAAEMGLVDALGTRREVEDSLADRLGRESVTVEEFRPSRGLSERLRGGAASVAYAAGAGVASVLVGEDATEVELR
jgi:protease-4